MVRLKRREQKVISEPNHPSIQNRNQETGYILRKASLKEGGDQESGREELRRRACPEPPRAAC